MGCRAAASRTPAGPGCAGRGWGCCQRDQEPGRDLLATFVPRCCRACTGGATPAVFMGARAGFSPAGPLGAWMHALWMLDTGSVMQGQQRPRFDCYSACLRSHERCHGAARCKCRLDVRRVPMSSSYGRFRPARPDACLIACSLSMMRACMFWASTQLRCATASEGPSAHRRSCRPAQQPCMPAPKGCAGEDTSCFRSCTRIHATTLNDVPTCCASCLLPGWPSAEGGGSGPAPPLPPVVVPPAGTRPNLLTIGQRLPTLDLSEQR